MQPPSPPLPQLPSLRRMARHATPRIAEGVVAPMALFYGALWIVGVWGALFTALGWAYTCVAVRWIRVGRPTGVTVIAALTMTARTVVAVLSGSVFVYFLQPTLGTLLVAAAFLVSVPARRPLAARLAADFFPLPAGIADHPRVETFFERISLLWGLVYVTNAAVTTWLLVSQRLETFLVAKTVMSMSLTGGAIIVCTIWFKRLLRRHVLGRPAAATA